MKLEVCIIYGFWYSYVTMVIAGAYEPPKGWRRSVRLLNRCFRRSSFAYVDINCHISWGCSCTESAVAYIAVSTLLPILHVQPHYSPSQTKSISKYSVACMLLSAVLAQSKERKVCYLTSPNSYYALLYGSRMPFGRLIIMLLVIAPNIHL